VGRLAFRLRELTESSIRGGPADAARTLVRRVRSDLYGACKRIAARARCRDGLVLCQVQGSRMYLDIHDPGLSRTLIRNGVRERGHTQLVKEEVKSGMVGVDIGANLGYYVLLEARLVGPTGHVLAVEPVPRNAHILRKNVAANGLENVTIRQCAISDEPGVVQMNVMPESNLCSLLTCDDMSLRADIRESRTASGAREQIAVPAVTFDDLVAENGLRTVNFIRMDIEGYELRATKGMTQTFRTAAGPLLIFVEVHNAHFADPLKTVAPWLTELLTYGFTPKAIAIEDQIVRDPPTRSFPAFVCSYETRCPHVLLARE